MNTSPNRASRRLSLMAACLVAALPAFGQDLAAVEPESAYPTVITPTRLRQSLQDVPASVTVLTAETLRRHAITNVPDGLRLVPGMLVSQTSGGMYLINYHGTNSRSPRRLNVLIDGISVYRPGLSDIEWAQLPVAIEDIERIEVTRGPNSAAYGPNSMMAIINIITVHPGDAARGDVVAGYGSNGLYRAYARGSTKMGATSVHASLSAEGNRGYDYIAASGTGHDTTATRRLLVRSHTPLGDAATLELQGAYVTGKNEVPFYESLYETPPDQDLRESYFGAKLTHRLSAAHEVQVRLSLDDHRTRQRWSACGPVIAFLPELFDLYRANLNYANTIALGGIPSGGTAQDDLLAARAIAAIRRLGPGAAQTVCANTNADFVQSRGDIELQDTYVVNSGLRVVAGVGARYERGASQTFLAGSVSNTRLRAFGNVEYKPTPRLAFNLGSYLEHDRYVGSVFSPRVAANYQLAANQSVRFVASQGTRTPDLLEQRGNYTYTSDGPVPGPDGSNTLRFYQSAVSPGGLRSEKVVSTEVGYLLNLPKYGVLFDLRVFNERLTSLISQTLDVAGFRLNNENSVRLNGAELQLSYALSPRWSGFATYAHLRNHGATTPLERSQYSRHSGSVGVHHDFGAGWRGAVAYYGASGNGLGDTHYGRLDVNASKTFAVGGSTVVGRIRYSRLANHDVRYMQNEAGTSIGRATLDNLNQVYADVRITF